MSAINFKSTGFESKAMFDFPLIINVEVYRGDCPCRCRHCPVGIKDQKLRQKTFGYQAIDLKLFTKIIDELAARPNSSLRIHSVGEPLLWPDLAAAIGLAKQKSVNTWIFTCAVTNNQELLKYLCRQVNIIEISVNSIDPADYLKTKGVDSFMKVKDNIIMMCDYIKKNNLGTRLIVSRVQSIAEKTDMDFVKYWQSSGLVDDAFIRSFHDYNNIISNFQPDKGKAAHQPCLVHWARFNINARGQAVVCFNELFKEKIEPDLILGDINTQSIVEIWQGDKLNAIRRAELANDYSILNFADVLPCKNCIFCQPLKSGRQTSEYQIAELKKHKHEKNF